MLTIVESFRNWWFRVPEFFQIIFNPTRNLRLQRTQSRPKAIYTEFLYSIIGRLRFSRTTITQSRSVSGNWPIMASAFGAQVEKGRGSWSWPTHLKICAVALVWPELRIPRNSSLA